MKKVASILLITIYAVATMGFSLKQFYCCGKLKSVSLAISSTEKENCVKAAAKDDCCKNKFQFHKVKDDHVGSEVSINSSADILYIANLYCDCNVSYIHVPFNADRINSPPLAHGVAAYITNCVFRI